ncbi:MAG: nucleotide exchange factor GrpE [Chthoniobacteraceae bacterium]
MSKANADTEDKTESADSQPKENPGGGTGAAGMQTADPVVEIAKWKDIALRTQAELDNYRKRVARDREEDAKRTQAVLLERLLPVIDNFELGMIEVRKCDPKSPIVVGMEMIERQLREFMSGSGVEAVEAVGAKFDPNMHEAISQEEDASAPEGQVLKQVRKGYKLRDRLLRAAMVIVSKGRPSA